MNTIEDAHRKEIRIAGSNQFSPASRDNGMLSSCYYTHGRATREDTGTISLRSTPIRSTDRNHSQSVPLSSSLHARGQPPLRDISSSFDLRSLTMSKGNNDGFELNSGHLPDQRRT
jgi:hypothetical protein